MGTQKKQVKKLTREDILRSLGDETTEKFNKMLSISIYAYRIKLYMYQKGALSPKGFLLNDDIFNLDLGKKIGGEIHIDEGVLKIFDRYTLVENFIESGDALTAFLIDHSDELYDVYRKAVEEDEDISSEEYLQVFNAAYNNVSADLLDIRIDKLLCDNKELDAAAKAIVSTKH